MDRPRCIAESTAAANGAAAARHGCINPNLVRVRGALRERVAKGHGADDDFEQIFLPAFQTRNFGAQGGGEFAIDRTALFDAKEVNAQGAFEKISVDFGGVRLSPNVGNARVGAAEDMVVDAERVRAKKPCAKI